MHSKVLAKILAAMAGTTLAFASFTAEAMPAGQIDGASAAPQITLAAEGCGPGFVRGPAGRLPSRFRAAAGCRRRSAPRGAPPLRHPRRAGRRPDAVLIKNLCA